MFRLEYLQTFARLYKNTKGMAPFTVEFLKLLRGEEGASWKRCYTLFDNLELDNFTKSTVGIFLENLRPQDEEGELPNFTADATQWVLQWAGRHHNHDFLAYWCDEVRSLIMAVVEPMDILEDNSYDWLWANEGWKYLQRKGANEQNEPLAKALERFADYLRNDKLTDAQKSDMVSLVHTWLMGARTSIAPHVNVFDRMSMCELLEKVHYPK